MPKVTSPHLYNLVQLLTKAEKAYFKTYTRRKSGNTKPLYLKLFNAIILQKTYDEKKLLADFNLKPNVFASLKNNLYSILLDCLRNFHTGNEVPHKVRELLYHAEILFNKNLLPPCLAILERALKIAVEYDLSLYALEITEFIQRVKEVERDIPWLKKKLPALLEKERSIVKKINNLRLYRKNKAVSITYRHGNNFLKNKKQVQAFEKIVDVSILRNEKQAYTFWAKIYYYQLNGIRYYDKNKIRESLRCYIQVKQLIDKHEKIKHMNTYIYNTAIHNILAVGLGILSFEDVKKYFRQFINTNRTWLTKDVDFTAKYYNNLLRIYIYYNISDKAEQVMKEVDEWLSKNEKQSGKLHSSSIIYFLSHLYFFHNNFKKSLFWLNNLVNNYNEKVENYVYFSSRLLLLVVNYEMKNYDQLPYIAKSTYSFLQNRRRMFKFEKVILHFFSKKLPNVIHNKKESLVLFQQLRKEILRQDTKEYTKRKILQYFDFAHWIDSKIKNKPFAVPDRKKRM